MFTDVPRYLSSRHLWGSSGGLEAMGSSIPLLTLAFSSLLVSNSKEENALFAGLLSLYHIF